MNVFFDVEGTLLGAGRARPHVRRVFEKLISEGHHVYIWSGGGARYAKNAAETLGVEDLIFGIFSKSSDLPVAVDFAVDDYPDLVLRHGGYVVEAFEGDPDDSKLLEVLGAVKAHER
ncbi:HAD hydrolase family protein [Rubrobacter indicoceani]|uniref:HAD hydrolase family protein n=1 Tax=Rubrobacter indicoceani TaxID=2051957 RepID=UPI000E5B32B7|nr:HAD hydrolase family protein [Rubrobacter indicoceani]